MYVQANAYANMYAHILNISLYRTQFVCNCFIDFNEQTIYNTEQRTWNVLSVF